MKCRLLTILSALSLLLFLAVIVLWVRGQSGADQAEWNYNRWLVEVHLSFENRLWVVIKWAHAPPRTPNTDHLSYYYVSADRSRGRLRLRLRHRPYIPGWGNDAFGPTNYGSSVYWPPLRWYGESHSRPAVGYHSHGIHVGVSHWLVALPLLVPPMLWLKRVGTARRARRMGVCANCGYDLRATPGRCPECGAARANATL